MSKLMDKIDDLILADILESSEEEILKEAEEEYGDTRKVADETKSLVQNVMKNLRKGV